MSKRSRCALRPHFGPWASVRIQLVFFQVVSEARFCVVCLLSKSRTRPCVLQIGNFILRVKICTPPILMSLPPPPSRSPFWLQACIIVQMIGFHRQYQRRPQHRALKSLAPWDFTQFLILLRMIKEACPIITWGKAHPALCVDKLR